MRLLIYEWSCSGGLAGPDRRAVIGDAAEEPLAREGRGMFQSLAADAVRAGDLEVVALVDTARPAELPPRARRVGVAAGAEIEALVAAARDADAAIIVAPETAGVLAARVATVRAAGGRVLAPDDDVIRVATDKQATIDVLAAAGVPVPAGRSLAAGEPWPASFIRPAVRKARASTGCDGVVIVRAGDPLPVPAPLATRIEALCAGTAVGVSCLLGPRRIVPVAALVQRFSAGPVPAYLGGEPLPSDAERMRAERLAMRAIQALLRRAGGESAAGWVGVDMILGDAADGGDDRVLEVN
ncbi:MAG: ATP-grasp domain-containing protein, partial [Pirellulales bacterium]